ncbi:hypothetical protein BIW11_05378 [Tropilaelaps mercedesae]|uniref:Uncharacterized protein n=1 Tax=Tropilaelaps mercedesae TaxID=418985 RepID=A0A1V9Y2I7_9ACAR|nr:hypothetical protein BIW11_05378 [Tropilaelaps mercedesae]
MGPMAGHWTSAKNREPVFVIAVAAAAVSGCQRTNTNTSSATSTVVSTNVGRAKGAVGFSPRVGGPLLLLVPRAASGWFGPGGGSDRPMMATNSENKDSSPLPALASLPSSSSTPYIPSIANSIAKCSTTGSTSCLHLRQLQQQQQREHSETGSDAGGSNVIITASGGGSIGDEASHQHDRDHPSCCSSEADCGGERCRGPCTHPQSSVGPSQRSQAAGGAVGPHPATAVPSSSSSHNFRHLQQEHPRSAPAKVGVDYPSSLPT